MASLSTCHLELVVRDGNLVKSGCVKEEPVHQQNDDHLGIPFCFPSLAVLMPFLTPVFSSNLAVVFPLCRTLHIN